MSTLLIDDHRIINLLSTGGSPGGIEVATTCSWWWRLSSAAAGGRGGALSRRLDALDSPVRRALRTRIALLRHHLVILDLGELIPAMALLAESVPVNQLAAEAVVAAEVLGAGIEVEVDSPILAAAAQARGIDYRVA